MFRLIRRCPRLMSILGSLKFSRVAGPTVLGSIKHVAAVPGKTGVEGVSVVGIIPTLVDGKFRLVKGVPGVFTLKGGGTKSRADDRSKTFRRGAERGVGDCLGQLKRNRSLRDIHGSFMRGFSRMRTSRVVGTRRRLVGRNAPVARIRGLYSIRDTLFRNTAGRRGVTGTRGTMRRSLGGRRASGGLVPSTCGRGRTTTGALERAIKRPVCQ